MNLSVCIITKNEKEKLKKCLSCLQPYAFEIVVVDTGSTDGTVEMVQHFTESVYHFTWCDDFAAAKNYAVSKAANDMVMVIDSDEYLCEMSQNKLKSVMSTIDAHPTSVGRIRRFNQYTDGTEMRETSEWIHRIFDRRFFHYEGRIHEQLVRRNVSDCLKQKSFEMDYEMYETDFVIDHDGYDGSVSERKKKAERNITLLLQEFEADPSDTYVLYQLGKGYYMAENYPEAVRYFELALGYDLNPKLEYVIDMVETYGYALLNSGQPETALLLESVYPEFGNTADFELLMGLIYMNNERFDDAVAELEKATQQREARTTGANSYLAYYNAGVIRECLGDTKQAVEYYKKCGAYGKAKQRLEKILT